MWFLPLRVLERHIGIKRRVVLSLDLPGEQPRKDFIKATLQSIAYQVRDIIDTMQVDAKTPIPVLKVDGGAAKNDYLMQFQADILGIAIARAKNLETTALGAAFLAGLTVGYWKDLEELKSLQWSSPNL